MGTHRDWLDNTKFSIGRFLCSLPMAYIIMIPSYTIVVLYLFLEVHVMGSLDA